MAVAREYDRGRRPEVRESYRYSGDTEEETKKTKREKKKKPNISTLIYYRRNGKKKKKIDAAENKNIVV